MVQPNLQSSDLDVSACLAQSLSKSSRIDDLVSVDHA